MKTDYGPGVLTSDCAPPEIKKNETSFALPWMTLWRRRCMHDMRQIFRECSNFRECPNLEWPKIQCQNFQCPIMHASTAPSWSLSDAHVVPRGHLHTEVSLRSPPLEINASNKVRTEYHQHSDARVPVWASVPIAFWNVPYATASRGEDPNSSHQI